jgi:hypothetical protein
MPLALLVLLAIPVDVASATSDPTRPIVLVVPLDVKATASTDALYAAFAARGVEAVGARERSGIDREEANGAALEASVDDVKDAIVRARAALHDFDTTRADAILDEGERLFLTLDRPDLARDVYTELLLVRADCALSTGDRARAFDAMQLFVVIAPEKEELHQGLYPPALVDLHREARELNARAPTAPVLITPRSLVDEPARTFIDLRALDDGEQGGAQSLSLTEGPHVVSAVAEGARSVSERIDVEAGVPVVRAPVLSEEDAATKRRALVARLVENPLADEAWAELMRLTGASVVVGVAATSGHVFARDVGVHPVAAPPSDAVGFAARALSTIETARQARLIDETRNEVDDEAESSFAPFAIGAGAVGAVVVTAVIASAIGALVWFFRPRQEPPQEPDRAALITCCGEGSG